MTRLASICTIWIAVLALAASAIAQPTFGPRPKKPKEEPKPADDSGTRPPPADAKPTPPKPTTPGVTQTPQEWESDDPARREPDMDAKPGEYFCWKTADGLRYAYSLPAKYEKGRSADLIVMLHPDKMDFRWGPSNHPRGEDGFAPDCIVVSVDGISANAKRPEARSFQPTAENCVRFRDVLLEFSRNLPVRSIYLYGQGGGGKFAAYFSVAFPALADGVLAHGTPIAENSAIKTTVPMVFMHGAKDSITPMRVSLENKQAYDEAGHKGVRVRILRGFNDYPSQIGAQDCIEYLRGMRTTDPADALAAAKRMLIPKGPDEFGYRPTPWFGAASAVLKRVASGKEGAGGAVEFESDPSAEQIKQAAAVLAKIQAEAQGHVDNAHRLLKNAGMDDGSFVLDGGPWLGYLLPLRDDFRGVECVETLAKDLKLDEQIAQHAEVAGELWQTWQVSGSDAAKFDRATDAIHRCFLFEGLPVDLLSRTRACMKKADELELEPESRNLYEFIQLWEQGWKDGMQAYELRWQRWTGE